MRSRNGHVSSQVGHVVLKTAYRVSPTAGSSSFPRASRRAIGGNGAPGSRAATGAIIDFGPAAIGALGSPRSRREATRPMKNDKRDRLSRRQFVKAAGTAMAVGALPGLACAPGGKKAPAAPKKLHILQWSHFVPGFDRWFDDVYTKEWGAKHGTEVIVDHMAATEVNARGAAEAAARKGHDLFLFISPPAA